MEEIKLQKEVAIIFEKAKVSLSERDIIRRAASSGFPSEFKRLNGIAPEILVKAYYFGYVIETPEDIVRELYLTYYGQGDFGDHVTKAIKKTLDAFSIKINGIN